MCSIYLHCGILKYQSLKDFVESNFLLYPMFCVASIFMRHCCKIITSEWIDIARAAHCSGENHCETKLLGSAPWQLLLEWNFGPGTQFLSFCNLFESTGKYPILKWDAVIFPRWEGTRTIVPLMTTRWHVLLYNPILLQLCTHNPNQLIAKPGNKTATVSWPDPYQINIFRCMGRICGVEISTGTCNIIQKISYLYIER